MATTPSTSCVQRAAFMLIRRCPFLMSMDRQARRMPIGATSVFGVRRPSPGLRGAAAGLQDSQWRRRRACQEVAGPARPSRQIAVAVRAAPVQHINRTIGAECALEAADEGAVGGGGKIHVTAFAVWAEFEHVSLIERQCLWSRRVLMSIAQTEPFRSMMIGSEAGAGGVRDASLDRTPTQPWTKLRARCSREWPGTAASADL